MNGFLGGTGGDGAVRGAGRAASGPGALWRAVLAAFTVVACATWPGPVSAQSDTDPAAGSAAEAWKAGYAAESAGEYDLAIAEYTRAIRTGDLSQTGLARVFRARGNAQHGAGNDVEALNDFETAIRLDPDYARAYVSRGAVRHWQGRFSEAVDDYDTAIGLEPDYALAYANRGGALEQLGQIDDAVLDFRKAYDLGYREGWLIDVLRAYDALP